MAATLDQLRDLGYTVGVAHGAVDVEEQALEQARAAAGDDVVAAQAQRVTNESLTQLAAAGQLPPEDQRQELAARIAAAALQTIQTRADDQVAFHERAVKIAKESPTVYHVAGHGCELYVAVDDTTGKGADKAAQQILDALAKTAR